MSTELTSLGFSLLSILIVSSLFFRSLWRGLLATLPSFLSIVGVLSWMGFAGIPLGVASSMFCAIVLGIGVDYAVHLLSRLQEEDANTVEVLSETTPVLFLDALAIGGAFSLLVLSRVPANALLGPLVVVSLALCLAVTLCFIPACRRETANSGSG